MIIPGGKNACGVYQKIINEITPHDLLIIPFLGNCGVLSHIRFNKAIGIDRDESVINYWKTKNTRDLILICADAISSLPSIISKYAVTSGRIFIYADPPYPIHTRKTKKKLYKYEISLNDHEKLLKFFLKLKCDIMISTYDNDLYSSYLQSWRRLQFQGISRAGKTTETIYMNYENKEGLLQDYRYLGDNNRQREWYRNRIKRFVAKLKRLPPKERNAIIELVKTIDTRK
jgi:DNA adenine methylase